MKPGDRLRPYEILAPLGAGGMGEVYRARDTKLDRDVAIKVLPATLAQDPERLARFEREAKVLAALNHPNIAQIYGLEQRALVMELVPGETLKGPLPLETALNYAKQIAEALEAAHEKGITHRDLKPANIMITPAGMVKVLDFGLAAVAQDPASSSVDPTNSPTLTMRATQVGMIMGTAAYMSPEQAAGKPVDKRADIWSFGVVLFELLTGHQLFDEGETISHTLADVLRAPIDLDKLPKETPRTIRDLLRRCLDRDAKTRLRDIGEARVAIDHAGKEQPDAVAVGSEPGSRALPWAIAAAVFALIATGVSILHFRESPPQERTLRYTIAAPENSSIHSFAISPDGRLIAMAAIVNGKQQLWLRALDALEAQLMPTTEDATYPFWSSDSRYIGFFAQGKLKKIAVSGGPALSLCDADSTRGGTWSREDIILFSQSGNGARGIQRVAATGGVPSDVVKDGVFRYPTFLPDGRHFLYTDVRPSDQSGIYASSPDGAENRRILADRSAALFAPSFPGSRVGHLLFVRGSTLMALPFDEVAARAAGEVFPLAEGIRISGGNAGYAPIASSENGVLTYWTGSAGDTNQMVWYDRAGKVLGQAGAAGAILTLAISPDEKSIAFSRSPAGGGNDIWLRDVLRQTETRLTTGGQNFAPFWSPKGDRIVFRSTDVRARQGSLSWKAANGSGDSEPLLRFATNTGVGSVPNQWSRDGRFIVYSDLDPKTKLDLWVLPLTEADRKPVPFLRTEFNEFLGQLSPDSRWMAYTSDESGQREVYVRPFPQGDGKWKISTAGGEQPRWRGDGKELFYVAADGKMAAVGVKAAPSPKPLFEPSVPEPLFEPHLAGLPASVSPFQYDVAQDGKRFLVVTSGVAQGAAAPPLTVVVNWQAALKK